MPTPNIAVNLLLVGVTSTLANDSTASNWLMSYGWLIGLIIIGMIGLALTNYRYLLGYFALGMVYWLGIEALHWLVVNIMPDMGMTNSYVMAIGMSLLPILGLVIWQPKQLLMRKTTPQPSSHYTQQPHRFGAGHRPFVLEKDTDFNQHYIRHASITDK